MFETITPLFPGLPGGPELLVVLLIVVLLFGANKIPKLARSSGQAIGEFQRGREEIEDELEDMPRRRRGRRDRRVHRRLGRVDRIGDGIVELTTAHCLSSVRPARTTRFLTDPERQRRGACGLVDRARGS